VQESIDVEVHQEAGGESKETQVRHYLGRVNRKKFVHGLELDNDTILDQEIDDVALCDPYFLVLEGYGNVATIRDSLKFKLEAQAGMIAGFQQTRAQMTMYLNRRPDDLFADPIGRMLDKSHSPSKQRNAKRSASSLTTNFRK